MVSSELRDAIYNYKVEGLHPGSYIQALIDNDLRKAIYNAHPLELEHIKDSLQYIDYIMENTK